MAQPNTVRITATPSGLERGRFQRLTVNTNGVKRQAVIFGLFHGHGSEFSQQKTETRSAIVKSVQAFRRDHYILAEGYEDELAEKAYKKSTGNELAEKPRDHIAEGVLSISPKLKLAERFEWHTIFPMTEADARCRQALETAATPTDVVKQTLPPAEARAAVQAMFEETHYDLALVRMIKDHDAKTLVQLTGLPEEDVRLAIERNTTFRSLMAARTALWRAAVMDVRLFMGVLHAAEIVEFMTNPDSVERYVRDMPELLKGYYEANEHYQKGTTQQFLRARDQALHASLEPFFLRWLAYQAYLMEYGLYQGVLDYTDYRRQLNKAFPIIEAAHGTIKW